MANSMTKNEQMARAKQRKTREAPWVAIKAYGTSWTVSGCAADRTREWIDADPLNAMRERGRDVLDVRSLGFVQHPHPCGPMPSAQAVI